MLALIDTSPALAHALGTLADELGAAFLGSASKLLQSLEALTAPGGLLRVLEEKLEAGVAEAVLTLTLTQAPALTQALTLTLTLTLALTLTLTTNPDPNPNPGPDH